MHFILNRDFTLVSTLGHAVQFVKDKPSFVPPPLYAEAKALGAEPTEDIPEEDLPAVSKAPTEQAERDAAIEEAINALTLKNQREDFTAGGTPHLKPLSDFVGWTVSAKERDRVISAMQNRA
jgi:hypothetical protein